MTYTQTQWIILFYFYCVAGWIWETGYVSLRQRQFVNRGFLHGPWLPIYGSGAIIILFTTLPVEHSAMLVFLVGMVSATALEYVTGALMERLFGMRYWDYSENPLNLNGHICLMVSIAWGFFSLLLVRVLHPPVGRLVHALSGGVLDAVSILLTVLFSVDVTRSVQEALDLKALLIRLTENNERLQRLDARLDTIAEKLESGSARLRGRLTEIEASRAAWLQAQQDRQEERTLSHGAHLRQRLEEHRAHRSRLLAFSTEKITAALSEAREQLQSAKSLQEHERLQRLIDSLSELLAAARRAEAEWSAHRSQELRRAVSILNRNPSARSEKYHQAASELKNLRLSLRARGESSREEHTREK